MNVNNHKNVIPLYLYTLEARKSDLDKWKLDIRFFIEIMSNISTFYFVSFFVNMDGINALKDTIIITQENHTLI